MICVSIDFSLPFTVTHQLHTCRYRKFVGINITCHTDWFLALREPEIIAVCQTPNNSVVNLTSFNPMFNPLTVSILTIIKIVCGFFFIVGLKIRSLNLGRRLHAVDFKNCSFWRYLPLHNCTIFVFLQRYCRHFYLAYCQTYHAFLIYLSDH